MTTDYRVTVLQDLCPNTWSSFQNCLFTEENNPHDNRPIEVPVTHGVDVWNGQSVPVLDESSVLVAM